MDLSIRTVSRKITICTLFNPLFDADFSLFYEFESTTLCHASSGHILFHFVALQRPLISNIRTFCEMYFLLTIFSALGFSASSVLLLDNTSAILCRMHAPPSPGLAGLLPRPALVHHGLLEGLVARGAGRVQQREDQGGVGLVGGVHYQVVLECLRNVGISVKGIFIYFFAIFTGEKGFEIQRSRL